MRTTIAIATFLAVGAGAVGVGALNLKGSDTLKEVTIDLLSLTTADCGGVAQGGTLAYDGSGSGNGQAAMVALTQQVAPMSRPFNNGAGICTSTAIDATKAEGIVFALDGISLAVNGTNWNSCNGATSNTCVQNTGLGLVNNKTITPDATRTCTVDADCNVSGVTGESCTSGVCTYTIPTWKEALRILYAGMSVPTSDATNRGKLALRDCASPERKYLAANWNQLFQSCTSGNCPNGVQHAFRRNDESGTSDLFVSLLQLPSITQGSNISPFCNVGTQGPIPNGTCTSFAAQSAADANSGAYPAPSGGNLNLNPPTEINVSGTLYRGEHFTDMQDADVIRRSCAFAAGNPQEDVCEARGDLGLVLPIWDIPDSIPQSDAFPVKACTTGKFVCVSATTFGGTCPDGSPVSNNPVCGNNNCPFPATAYTSTASCTQDSDCGTAAQQPAPPGICATNVASPTGKACTPVLDPRCVTGRLNPPPGRPKFDARVFNLTAFTADTANFGAFPRIRVPRATGMNPPCGSQQIVANIPMVAGFYKIHSVHSFNTESGAAATCQTNSSTEQIGCLVQASPCSIGYAGNSSVSVAVNGVQDAVALKVNGVDPQDQCIRNLIANTTNPAVGTLYPLSRKLYLNTIKGFGNVAGDETKLADCFAKRSVVDPLVTSNGFVTLSLTPATQPTFCEDFNEVSTCTGTAGNLYTGTNVDACHDAPTNPAPIPDCELSEDLTVGTSCGHLGG